MIIIDIIFEIIGYAIIESLPRIIGIGTKWLFYLGQKPIAIISKENWNSRIGFLVLLSVFLILIYLAN